MDSLQEKHLDTKRGLHYRYYVSNAGDTSKPTLLLLHGWPDSAQLWQSVIPYLAKLNLKMIIPDLLGYGGTSKPTQVELYDHRRMSEDIIEVLDAENIGKVIPIGHDFGCWFTFKFQALYHERCVAAVHIGVAYTPPITQMPDLDTLNAIMEQQIGYPRYTYFNLFTDDDAPALFSQNMDIVWHVMHGDGKDWMKHIFCTPNAMREFIEAGSTDVSLKPYAQDSKLKESWMAEKLTAADWQPTFCWYRAFTSGLQSEADKSISLEQYTVKIPVLTIMCDGDGVNPPETLTASKDAGLLPDLKDEVLHSGHWCTYERPEELSRMITEFVREKGFAD